MKQTQCEGNHATCKKSENIYDSEVARNEITF